MTFKEAKARLEKMHYTVTETEDEIKTQYEGDDGYIVYFKNDNTFTARGYGSVLVFMTCPVFEPWRDMIIAWKEENQNERL